MKIQIVEKKGVPWWIHQTIKLLEDNIGENVDDLECDNDFLDATPRA